METKSLFVIGARIVPRRLKVISVVRGEALVGENTLLNLFRLNFGQWWYYASFHIRGLYGRHGRGE